jgi:hypothetical protein
VVLQVYIVQEIFWLAKSKGHIIGFEVLLAFVLFPIKSRANLNHPDAFILIFHETP